MTSTERRLVSTAAVNWKLRVAARSEWELIGPEPPGRLLLNLSASQVQLQVAASTSGTDSETLTEAEHIQGPGGPEASEQGDADRRRAEDSADGIFNQPEPGGSSGSGLHPGARPWTR